MSQYQHTRVPRRYCVRDYLCLPRSYESPIPPASPAQSFFGFGPSAELLIELKDAASRDTVTVKDENGTLTPMYLFTGSDPVQGTLTVRIPRGKKLEHTGIKIELVGQIEFIFDRGNPHEFQTVFRDLEPAGELTSDKVYAFDFSNVEKPNETYSGNNIRLRYFLRARINRQYATNIVQTLDLAVQNVVAPPEQNNCIKMEVGIEDCLHIEFEYQKSKYHLRDVVVGKIYFLLVRIKIKHMEVVIIKRESTGSGPNAYNESENISKFEIMDGAPVRGETIPIRLYLSPYRLSPTFRNIHNKFSVRYYLNLVLVDEEDRRYFKQQEIQLWRSELTKDSKDKRKGGAGAGASASAAAGAASSSLIAATAGASA